MIYKNQSMINTMNSQKSSMYALLKNLRINKMKIKFNPQWVKLKDLNKKYKTFKHNNLNNKNKNQ